MKTARFIQAAFIFIMLVCGAAESFAAPAHDNYQNAFVTTMTEPAVEYIHNNFGATKELGEPWHANNPGGKSVWYRIVPQQPAIIKIQIKQTSFGNGMNTLLAVYRGFAPSEFNLIAQNDDVGDDGMSRVDIKVVPGHIYYVAVDGFNDGAQVAQGGFRLRFEKFAVPENDNPDFDKIIFLPEQSSGFISGTNSNATKEPGEANLTDNPGGKSVWYVWQAPLSRVTTVELSCNSFVEACFDMQLGVFAGGTKVASNDNFENSTEKSSVTFLAQAGVMYTFVIDGIKKPNGVVEEGTFTLNYYPHVYRYDSNFDATDRKTDLTVFRPASGIWYTLKSSNNQAKITQFGASGDTTVPADYDGDGVTDIAVARNNAAGKTWYILRSGNNSFQSVQWGVSADKPLVADYDGDGVADMVAVRQSAQGLQWYIRPSSSPNSIQAYQFGANTDQPVIGNFVKGLEFSVGVQIADLAVVRVENNQKYWYIQSQGSASFKKVQFGLASDVNVAADYDADGYTDVAVWRPENGTWYVIKSLSNHLIVQQWGAAGDIPQPAQYDGGGNMDFAVYRPTTGTWWIYKGSGQNPISINWGLSGDKPVSSLTGLVNP